MKKLIFSALWLAFAMPLHAQAPASQPALLPHQQAYLNLPQEKRTAYVKLVEDAKRLIGQKRVFESIEKLNEARAIFKDDPDALTVYGACQIEFRAFDKAQEAFDAALKLDPGSPNILYNIAEVKFVTKNWNEAISRFEQFMKLAADPKNGIPTSFQRVVEFKILLSKIKLGKDEEVQVLAAKYDFTDDSPYYYYANAALQYAAKDEVKAYDWLSMAARIYRGTNVLYGWDDALTEVEFVPSAYGTSVELE